MIIEVLPLLWIIKYRNPLEQYILEIVKETYWDCLVNWEDVDDINELKTPVFHA